MQQILQASTSLPVFSRQSDSVPADIFRITSDKRDRELANVRSRITNVPFG
jgi:hypothetical protein